MKKVFGAVALFLCLLSFLSSGCSSINTKAQENASTMEQIKKRGTIIVGIEASFFPFEFVQNGEVVGYGPDILNEVAKNLDLKIEYFDVPFHAILPGLENSQFDFVATSLAVTDERKQRVAFTVPIANISQVLVKRKGNSTINSLDDLNGKVFGCNLGSNTEKFLHSYNESLKAQGQQGFEIKTYPSNSETFLDLKSGRIDVINITFPMAEELLKKEPDTYELAGSFGTQLYMSWATRKEDTELLELLNSEILQLKKSGKLAKMQEKWFGTTWDLPDQLP